MKNIKTIKGESSNIFIKGKFTQTVEIKIIEGKKFMGKKILEKLGKRINIKGKSKGKGFCGVIKRYGFKSNRASHGNSKAHNKPGSIGMCQDPGRVFKGKKMAGQKGNRMSYIYNIIILKIEKNKILLKGSIPGSKNTKIYLV